jgi:hypothetical protein
MMADPTVKLVAEAPAKIVPATVPVKVVVTHPVTPVVALGAANVPLPVEVASRKNVIRSPVVTGEVHTVIVEGVTPTRMVAGVAVTIKLRGSGVAVGAAVATGVGVTATLTTHSRMVAEASPERAVTWLQPEYVVGKVNVTLVDPSVDAVEIELNAPIVVLQYTAVPSGMD